VRRRFQPETARPRDAWLPPFADWPQSIPAQLQRIMHEAGHHFVGETFPGDIAPVSRNIFIERIVLQVALVEKGAAALPGQRGHLPDLAVSEFEDERVASFLVLRGEQKY